MNLDFDEFEIKPDFFRGSLLMHTLSTFKSLGHYTNPSLIYTAGIVFFFVFISAFQTALD